jgi:methyltransferase (TIGR00027 family)
MRAGRASRTAQHNALFRALESTRPRSRRLFDDPLARAFLGRPFALVVALAAVPGLREALLRFIDARWPGVRTAVAARTRLIDAALTAALAERPEQVVVLGAGFDSRPYRLPALRGASVFEVDHPDTQAAKRRALEHALGVLPGNVRFVATDFGRGGLAAAMGAAGYREAARSVFLWEGCTNYLTEAAVDDTLRWCARAAAGSRLLFTYVDREVLANPRAYAGGERLFASLDKVGERFTFGLHPGELADFLARRGLVLERDVGAVEFRALAYGDAAQRMRGHEFYRVAQARVAGPSAPPC